MTALALLILAITLPGTRQSPACGAVQAEAAKPAERASTEHDEPTMPIVVEELMHMRLPPKQPVEHGLARWFDVSTAAVGVRFRGLEFGG